MAPFFERFRSEVARYAEGVHRLGDPAPAGAVAGLPEELAAFLRSWNGAELFIDALSIYDAAAVARDGELVVFGATAAGDRLALDAGGAVLRIEEDTGETLVEGTSFARWIEGFVVAEGVLYDREGDFREELFDDVGRGAPAGGERAPRAQGAEDRPGRAGADLAIGAGARAARPRGQGRGASPPAHRARAALRLGLVRPRPAASAAPVASPRPRRPSPPPPRPTRTTSTPATSSRTPRASPPSAATRRRAPATPSVRSRSTPSSRAPSAARPPVSSTKARPPTRSRPPRSPPRSPRATWR